MNWKIEYENDTGLNDDNYSQWYNITNGIKTYISYNEKNAEWLCKTLNDLEKE